MSLKQWAENGWLRAHKTSPEEIKDLLAIVERDLADAESEVSEDWRFGIAYNAALKLCTILLYAEGFRAEGALKHYRTIHALPLILGSERVDDSEYLETCRRKRNIVEYDYVGAVTKEEVKELHGFTKGFRDEVLNWLKKKHPELINTTG